MSQCAEIARIAFGLIGTSLSPYYKHFAKIVKLMNKCTSISFIAIYQTRRPLQSSKKKQWRMPSKSSGKLSLVNNSLLPIFGHEAFSHIPRFNCRGAPQITLFLGYSNYLRIIPFEQGHYLPRLFKNVVREMKVNGL